MNTIDSNKYRNGIAKPTQKIENNIYWLACSSILDLLFVVGKLNFTLRNIIELVWNHHVATVVAQMFCLPNFASPKKFQACQMDTRLFGQQLNGSFFSPLGQKRVGPGGWSMHLIVQVTCDFISYPSLWICWSRVRQEYQITMHNSRGEKTMTFEWRCSLFICCRVDSSSHFLRKVANEFLEDYFAWCHSSVKISADFLGCDYNQWLTSNLCMKYVFIGNKTHPTCCNML